MGSDFARPSSGFRYNFGGVKTNALPDALPPDKYAMAVNVRGVRDQSVQTRPGQSLRFTTLLGATASVLTDLSTYAALGTDNLPRILAVDNAPVTNGVWLDNGVRVGGLANSGATGPGAAMIPFRPSQSPNPYLYIANGVDYQKFSAPSAVNVVIQQKVGIAEPQDPPEAVVQNNNISQFTFTGSLTASGTTTGVIGTGTPRVTDTAGVVLADPIGGVPGRYSIQVSPTQSYQRLMGLLIANLQFVVEDVLAPVTSILNIAAIYYFTGTTGRCIVVPQNIAAGPGDQQTSANLPNLMGTLRRGSLIQIGAEICLVWSVTDGPAGAVAIETSTTGTHTTADTLTGVPAIVVLGNSGVPVAGQTMTQGCISIAITAGIGVITGVVASNPFALAGQSYQADDYISFGVVINGIANLNELRVLFDVGDGTFTENFYYYAVRPSDIQLAIQNNVTQLAAAQTVAQRDTIDNASASIFGVGNVAAGTQLPPGNLQWLQITVPITALIRVGSDATKTLQNINHMGILVNVNSGVGGLDLNTDFFQPTPTSTSGVAVFVSGAYQPDVGDAGAPYQYRVRPRSSVTGARGNPSPATRYSVNPRREQVLVTLPSAAYDPQIDTWDIERFGGSVTSWRMIGSTAAGNASFLDNYDDVAANEGEALDFDNFEPWPSIDLPLNANADVFGTVALVTIPTPTLALRYLPGNLLQLGTVNVYTLRRRPVKISGNIYRVELLENAGVGVDLPAQIYEPALANQPLPYMWGPDASGTVFACGDPLRPSTLYFAKNYAPDSAPDGYNIEIAPPTEPLAGGVVLDGLSFVASTERWWALYPQPDNAAQRYSVVQQPFTRGLAAPYGVSTDGQSIYWWAKDGIMSSSKGSLTDADLHNLFPHEGVLGNDVTYNGTIIKAPSYDHAGTFRLAYANYYLYATYQSADGVYRCLVCDTRTGAWTADVYTPAVSAVYHPTQQAGTLQSNTQRYDEVLMAVVATNFTTGNAMVAAQQDFTNDLGGPIACALAVAEFDGGDVRAPKQWGDVFLDATPAAPTGLVATPMSLGAGVAAPTTIATSASRVRSPVSVGGLVVSDFLGLLATWTDDFTVQAGPTQLIVWQPSFVVQPARTIAWTTLGSSFGVKGYLHIREIEVAWVSTAAITLTITSYDGQSPAAITIPSSSGAYQKVLFPLTANKGQLFKFAATSTAPFQLFLDDMAIRVGAWERTDVYMRAKNFGGGPRDAAPI